MNLEILQRGESVIGLKDLKSKNIDFQKSSSTIGNAQRTVYQASEEV